MPDQQIGFARSRGLALGRAAEAMLRSLGGCEVALRFPAVMTSSGNARLGTAAISTEDVLVSPVVVRTASERSAEVEFVFPAEPLACLLDQRQTDAETLFRSATGIVYQNKLFRVTRVATNFYAGAAYLYRITAGE